MAKIIEIYDCVSPGGRPCPYLGHIYSADEGRENIGFQCEKVNPFVRQTYVLKANLFKKCPLPNYKPNSEETNALRNNH